MTWTAERHARNRARLAALPERPWHAVDIDDYWTVANRTAPRTWPTWCDLLASETDASEDVAQFCADAPVELAAAMDEVERVTAQWDRLVAAVLNGLSFAEAAEMWREIASHDDGSWGDFQFAIADALDVIAKEAP